MNSPVFELKNKIIRNTRKEIHEKNEVKSQISKEMKKNTYSRINTLMNISDNRKFNLDQLEENKNSILIHFGDESIAPLNEKHLNRNKRLSFIISDKFKGLDNTNSWENKCKYIDKEPHFKLKKEKIIEKFSISNINSPKSNKTKSFNNNHRIFVDASKVRENDVSKLIDNYGSIEKNIFENDGIHLIVSSDISYKHILLIDLWICLENGIDNKHTLNLISSKLINSINEEVIIGDILKSDLFSSPLLNKTYSKIIKLFLIILIFIRFIVIEFTYELGLKNSLKNLLYCVSENLVNIGEMFILQKLIRIKDVIKKEIIDKFNKSCKAHKINRNQKTNDLIFIMNKNNDNIITLIHDFSREFFNTHHFKNVFAATNQLVNNLNNYSAKSLTNTIIETILFTTIHRTKNEEKLGKKIIIAGNSLLMKSQIKVPFLPNSKDASMLTLVLDLDETLVHHFSVDNNLIKTPTGRNFMIRPGLNEFLSSLAKSYEIVIFTASTKEVIYLINKYADFILNYVDRESIYISNRLYRNHLTSNSCTSSFKDLSKVGRDLSKVIIVDNFAENFKLQPFNGLEITTWEDDINDTQLYDLLRILKEISKHRVPDVREIIKKIKEEYNNFIRKKETRPYSKIDVNKFIQKMIN